MHTDFRQWYSVVSLSPSQPLLESRSRAITRIVETATSEELLDITRIYLGAKSEAIAYTKNMRAVFLEEDKTFQAKGNNAELQVLSGATIVELVTKNRSTLTDIVALALSSAQDMRQQQGPLVPHLIPYTENYLVEESREVRIFYPTTKIVKAGNGAPTIIKKIEEYEQSVTAGTATAQMGIELLASIKQLQSLDTSYLEQVSDAEKSTSDNNAILREENEILWWMLGGRCLYDMQQFAALPIPLAALLVGKELAELTKFLPEHPYAMAVINEVLCKVSSDQYTAMSVQDIASAVPEPYKTLCVATMDNNHTSDFCPVHAAILDLHANNNKSWLPAWAYKPISFSEPRSAVRMAYQVYIECLFIKSLAQ